jgi:choice-of-anchor C domain-containing protein
MLNKTLIFVIVTVTVIAFLAVTRSVQAQTIYNGSFEIGTLPASGTQLNAVDSTSISGWTVATGNIDYITSDRWQAEDGSRSLDMNGVTAGTIYQVVNGFTVGQQYTLDFYMAANPETPYLYPPVRTMNVSVGSTSQTFSFDLNGQTATNMGWTLESLPFTATSSSITVTFQSLTQGAAGPTLDNVSIVPEPSVQALALMLVGLSYGWSRRQTWFRT